MDIEFRHQIIVTVSLIGLLALPGCTTTNSEMREQSQKVEICLNGICSSASERYNSDQLLGGLLLMLKKNENVEGILCDSDASTRECVDDNISWYVQGGLIPGVSSFSKPYLKNVSFNKETDQVKFAMAGTVKWIGTPVFCRDAEAEVTVNSVEQILIEVPSVACTWTVLPNAWNMKFFVELIDFDKSIIAGTYKVKGGGLPIFGSGGGDFTMSFPKQHTLLETAEGMITDTVILPEVHKLPFELLAPPVSRPEGVPENTADLKT